MALVFPLFKTCNRSQYMYEVIGVMGLGLKPRCFFSINAYPASYPIPLFLLPNDFMMDLVVILQIEWKRAQKGTWSSLVGLVHHVHAVRFD